MIGCGATETRVSALQSELLQQPFQIISWLLWSSADSQNAYESFYEGGDDDRHKAKFSHEAVAGTRAS